MDELEKLRQELATIDRELLDQFRQRMEIARQVAAYKGRTGSAVFVPEQEERILKRSSGQVAPELSVYAEAFLRTLMRLSRARQYEVLLDASPDVPPGPPAVETIAIPIDLGEGIVPSVQKLYPAKLKRVTDDSFACLEVVEGALDLAILPWGEESLLLAEKHALFLQACLRIDDLLYAVLGARLNIPLGSGRIGFLVQARTLPFILGILSDLAFSPARLQALRSGVFHLEFIADPADSRGLRVLHQIEQEVREVYVLGWYDQRP